MPDATQPNRPRHRVRTALVRLFGRPCLKQHVLWSLAVALGVGILFGLWLLVPIIPKATMHPGHPPYLHAFSPDSKTLVTSGDAHSRLQGPIRLWDVGTGQQRLAIVANRTAVHHVEVSPEGEVFTG